MRINDLVIFLGNSVDLKPNSPMYYHRKCINSKEKIDADLDYQQVLLQWVFNIRESNLWIIEQKTLYSYFHVRYILNSRDFYAY